MSFSPQLVALGQYLAGEFDNHQQAMDSPAWYVHLRLWKRPAPLFTQDSLTLFAEQANIVYLDKPYRPRLLRLRQDSTTAPIQVDYYMLKDVTAYQGAGRNPELLNKLTPEQVQFLPGCSLQIEVETLGLNQYRFKSYSRSQNPCTFTYQGNTYQISLGFEVTADELQIYDKGIDPATGKATWGALLGPFRFTKLQDFSNLLPVNNV